LIDLKKSNWTVYNNAQAIRTLLNLWHPEMGAVFNSMPERLLPKQDIVDSNPITRSKKAMHWL
jgi:hypothetical protein